MDIQQLDVDLGERSYPISIGGDLLSKQGIFNAAIAGRRVMLVTNETIAPLYLESVKSALAGFELEVCIIPDGEQYKTLSSFDLIMSALLEANHGRDTTLIALGGGVIGDLTGFAAACFQRGVAFIQIPTTLLSQVDSSVGGKTAVNHPLGKNMIGAFYQPQMVLIDYTCLKTLDARQLSAGLAEVIKYGIIYDADFFLWLETNISSLLAQDASALSYAIYRCCEIKAEVVALDEKEHGIRALLNLGHTFGHAIEAEQGYGNWLHGEAVAVGMIQAAHVAMSRKQLTLDEFDRISCLIKTANLPITGPKMMDFDAFMQHMRRDKKVLNGTIRFILPTAIGKAAVYSDVSETDLAKAIAATC